MAWRSWHAAGAQWVEAFAVRTPLMQEADRLCRAAFGPDWITASRDCDGVWWVFWRPVGSARHTDFAGLAAPPRPAAVRWHDPRVLSRGLTPATDCLEIAGVRYLPVFD